MAFVSRTLFSIVTDHHPWLLLDETIDMKSQSNQLSPLLYFNKYNDVKKKLQMPLHNDNLFKKVGREWVFHLSRNSQKQNTPTIVLTVGDPRLLKFNEKKVGSKAKPVKNLVSEEFWLEHGEIFFLHPLDERPKKNSKNYDTNFVHGGVEYGGDDRLSVALCFRTTTSELLCKKDTGLVWVTEQDKMKWKKRDDMLKDIEHVQRGCNLKSKQDQIQFLYKDMLTRFF